MANKSKKSKEEKIETIKKQNAKVIKAVGKQLDKGEVSKAQANRITNRLEKTATSRMKHIRRKKDKNKFGTIE